MPNADGGSTASPDLDGINSALRPRFRLFCSIDLVGSTAYKQLLHTNATKPEDEQAGGLRSAEWFDVFLSFYSAFEATLRATAGEYGKAAETKLHPKIPEIEFWKSNGDELLFSFEIETPDQLQATFHVWVLALQAYRANLLEETADLDVKSAAWTAGFPVMNTEVIFHTSPQQDVAITPLSHQHRLRNIWYDERGATTGYTRDFIGPSIDTGFRIAAKSTPRKMMVSAELCYLLCSSGKLHKDIARPDIFFEPSQPLKGVIGGRPYPVIWVAIDGNERQIAEEKLLGILPANRETLGAFCEAFIKDCQRYMWLPFMYDSSNQAWGDVPDGYLDGLRQLQDRLTREEKKDTAFSRSADDEGAGVEPKTDELKAFVQRVTAETPPATPSFTPQTRRIFRTPSAPPPPPPPPSSPPAGGAPPRAPSPPSRPASVSFSPTPKPKS